MENIIVTQVKSSIGVKKEHRLTLHALGLRKTGQQRKHKVSPALQGMLDSVRHLIKVEKA
ncbi:MULTISPECIES: 50S ribosomal protein L30 [Leptospira]|uniref:Large ribosomal subunit protein uL30 n=6 Tax=Leptospira santarosai TaxID=28183 RepID=A0A2P1QUZ7_9LEPT|nr:MULTISPECIES: 50S ribosomal protein L30 [Leptospira]EMO59299.1 ribosomal protein L30 [Leptospira santarosai str. CBC1416]ASV12543.1 50S ribosomal protein L30 [Leptospira santarosai]AVQ12724.1 50S ribosomal protein L30 [Leptospira santarosai]AVV79684.1 50S ribosomal protein L30 [Leptospira santarosai]EKO35295.1 ribosomal protein L30 [Leptospira santarosai str. MOR084]